LEKGTDVADGPLVVGEGPQDVAGVVFLREDLVDGEAVEEAGCQRAGLVFVAGDRIELADGVVRDVDAFVGNGITR
jgi:hypothetical protein